MEWSVEWRVEQTQKLCVGSVVRVRPRRVEQEIRGRAVVGYGSNTVFV